ncbi:MAG: hypothetical protein KDD69_17640 [Bdellovibrionales bacterium]|nr:hypothetical protein [Bdellovibrionales bacterium]
MTEAKMIEQFLREKFQKPQLGVVGQVLKEAPEYSYKIVRTEPHTAAGIFDGVELFWVWVEDNYLGQPLVPGNHSRGLFASTADTIWYIDTTEPQGLPKLLPFLAISAVDAAGGLAAVVCDGLLSTGKEGYQVVTSTAGIQQLAKERSFTATALNDAAVLELQDIVREPQYTGESSGPLIGTLRFFALAGPGVGAKRLSEVTAEIAGNEPIRISERILCDRILTSLNRR